MTPKHPDVSVDLLGADGNAFAIIARVRKAMRRSGLGEAELQAYTDEAKSGDYANVLATTRRWVTCN
jgi:hypothetical protein